MIRSMFGKTWWVLLVRGLLAVLVGGFVLANPVAGLGGMLAFLATWWVVTGVAGVVGSLRARDTSGDWWLLLVAALAGLAFGLLAFVRPGLSLRTLTLLVGTYALVEGLTAFWAGVRLQREVPGEIALTLAGLLASVAGVLLLMHPFTGLVSLVLLFGLYATMVGVLLCVAAVRARRFGELPGVPAGF